MVENHLAAVDLDAVLLFQSLCNILCGDGAVKLFISAASNGEFDENRGKLRCELVCGSLFGFDLVKSGSFLVFSLVECLCICNDGELACKKEVARVAVGNLDDVALFALGFNVLCKNYFHCYISLENYTLVFCAI